MNLIKPGNVVKVTLNGNHFEAEVCGIKIHHDLSVEYIVQNISNGTIKSECVASTMVEQAHPNKPLKIGFNNDSK